MTTTNDKNDGDDAVIRAPSLPPILRPGVLRIYKNFVYSVPPLMCYAAAHTKHGSPCLSIYLVATIAMPFRIFATSNPFRFSCST